MTPCVKVLGAMIFGYIAYDVDMWNNALKELKDALKVVNKHLQGKKFIVGESLTIADIIFCCTLTVPFQLFFEAGYRNGVMNITGLYQKVSQMKEFLSRMGNVHLCKKPFKFPEPKKDAVEKKEKVKSGKGKSKEEYKNEKKEDPKKEAPAPAATPAAEAAPAPKQINPIDSLPPTTLVLDDFKKKFVNSKSKKNDLADFFKSDFDAQGWSFWFLQYEKYEDEGQKLYLTSNLMNGFLQRADHLRKHLFAYHCVLGEEPNLEIQGVWMTRGQDIGVVMVDHPQFEYYKSKKLDHTKAADMKMIEEFWCAKDGDKINGLASQDLKSHK